MKLKTPDGRGWAFAVVTGAIAVGLTKVLDMGEVHHGWWDNIFGWWALYGFFGCAVIIVVSKALGSWFLQKREDWYE